MSRMWNGDVSKTRSRHALAKFDKPTFLIACAVATLINRLESRGKSAHPRIKQRVAPVRSDRCHPVARSLCEESERTELRSRVPLCHMAAVRHARPHQSRYAGRCATRLDPSTRRSVRGRRSVRACALSDARVSRLTHALNRDGELPSSRRRARCHCEQRGLGAVSFGHDASRSQRHSSDYRQKLSSAGQTRLVPEHSSTGSQN
jgi:hypothetical protein